MDHLDLLQSFLERCQSEQCSRADIGAAFHAAIERLGFRYFACCSRIDPRDPPTATVLLHNYPAAWARRFRAAGLFRLDPVLQLAERTPAPFFWDAAFATRPITERQRGLLEEAAGYGIAHGYTVPLEACGPPGSPRASCSVVPEGGAIDPRSYTTVQLLALYLYAFTRRARMQPSGAMGAELTPRERQCLQLVACGKTDWEIARLLGLSPFTVHYHIERAKRRFDVITRIQAVVQALRTGQISCADGAPK